jgi:TDG/mug DNA glycosylase family protein
MPELRICTREGAHILFIGINPGLSSGALGHHFAAKGNPFWRLLHASGITPRQLAPEEDVRLPELGLGVVNMCKRPTRTAAELTRDEIAVGRRELRALIERLRPRVVAFAGLMIYQDFFDLPSSGGAGEKPERIGDTRVFALPNPSGINANFPGFATKLVWFVKLKEFAATTR